MLERTQRRQSSKISAKRHIDEVMGNEVVVEAQEFLDANGDVEVGPNEDNVDVPEVAEEPPVVHSSFNIIRRYIWGSAKSGEPQVKRQKISVEGQYTRLLQSPSGVKQKSQSGIHTSKHEVIRALANCVVAASLADNEDTRRSALDLLASVLDQDGISPNCTNEKVLFNLGGTPLHLAIELKVPEAAELLLRHGASLCTEFKGVTPLRLAFDRSSCLNIIFAHIDNMEKCII